MALLYKERIYIFYKIKYISKKETRPAKRKKKTRKNAG